MPESTINSIKAVIGSYADYLHVHYSRNEEGKFVEDYSLGEFIVPEGYTAKQIVMSLGSFVKEEDFANVT